MLNRPKRFLAWVLQRHLTSGLVTESVMKLGGMLVKDGDQSFHAHQLKKCANAEIIIRENGASLV